MSTRPAAANSPGHITQVLRAMHPGIEEARLQKLASEVKETLDAASSVEDFDAITRKFLGILQGMPGDHSKFFVLLENFRRRQIDLLKETGLSPSSVCSPAVARRIDASAVESAQEVFGPPKTAPQDKCRWEGCTTTAKLLRCSRCHLAKYCSEDHQRSDWSRHQVECIQVEK